MTFFQPKAGSVDYKSAQLVEVLKTKWDEIHNNSDVFRYKINNLQERLVDEKYLLQLNPNRKSNRRKPEEITDIKQPFDINKFHFKRIPKEEVMFAFEDNDTDHIHEVIVNVSPISRYHSLLVPSIQKCLPQVIDKDSLKLTIDIILSAQDRDLRIGFNSLCALASVNQLHYHILFEKTKLPVETVKCKQIKGPLYCFDDSYPIPAFCFEITKDSQKVDDIYKLLDYLLQNSIAHNVLLTRGVSFDGNNDIVRVIIWPRKSSSGPKQLETFNVAVLELSGWFPVYNSEDFEKLKTEDLENELKKWRIPNFENLCRDLESLY